jgi:hypothetical protein
MLILVVLSEDFDAEEVGVTVAVTVTATVTAVVTVALVLEESNETSVGASSKPRDILQQSVLLFAPQHQEPSGHCVISVK